MVGRYNVPQYTEIIRCWETLQLFRIVNIYSHHHDPDILRSKAPDIYCAIASCSWQSRFTPDLLTLHKNIDEEYTHIVLSPTATCQDYRKGETTLVPSLSYDSPEYLWFNSIESLTFWVSKWKWWLLTLILKIFLRKNRGLLQKKKKNVTRRDLSKWRYVYCAVYCIYGCGSTGISIQLTLLREIPILYTKKRSVTLPFMWLFLWLLLMSKILWYVLREKSITLNDYIIFRTS